MATKKLTQEDIKAGRVYRCINCETKCDGRFERIMVNIESYGQCTERSTFHFCGVDCARYYSREQERETIDDQVTQINKILDDIIPRVVYGLRAGADCSENVLIIKALKAYRLYMKKTLSRELTYAELMVGAHDVREVMYEASEKVQECSKNELKYKLLTKFVGCCSSIMDSASSAWQCD
jgi:hypothetical protein